VFKYKKGGTWGGGGGGGKGVGGGKKFQGGQLPLCPLLPTPMKAIYNIST